MSDKKVLKVIIIGAGNRGCGYSQQMKKSNGLFEVVGVAEPIDVRRDYIRKMWNLDESMCFEDYKEILELPRLADVAVIATMDRMHKEPAMMAMEKGYHLLLEKPVAPTEQECLEIEACAKKNNVKVLVCHVLRYTPFYRKLKEVIDSGRIGEVVSIHHMECVWNVHQSHSFVRGNWGNSEKSSCMILQKSCHDMDILQWLIGKKCTKVHSFGSLTYFTKENAPVDAPEYCIEGCPHKDTCYYNAVKLYYDDKDNLWFREAATKKIRPTDEEVEETLRTTQYGKCVFKCDNNVVDHQVVNLEFENGATVSFNMCAFNSPARSIRIMGTKGEIIGSMSDENLDFYDFLTQKHISIKIADTIVGETIVDGHGGGDSGIVNALYQYVAYNIYDENLSEISISVKNHRIAFAAEESRLSGKVIQL